MQAGGGGREEVRRLGDGPDSGKGTEECDTDPVREEQELPHHGASATRPPARRRGGDGRQAALAVQEERADDNHGQRRGVLPPPEDSRGAEDHRVLRRQLRLVAEGSDREHQQTHPAVHPERDRFQGVERRLHPFRAVEDKPEAKGKA